MKQTIAILTLIIILITGCQQRIGGQTDKGGCLVGAGYSWNESVGACVREWELDESQREAAKIAVAPMSVRPITIIEVKTLKCPGCFNVKLQVGENIFTKNIANWQIEEKSAEITNFEECAAAGNPIMESYPRQCNADGNTFTEESCTSDKGDIITLSDAITIAKNSECENNLIIEDKCPEGYRKDGESCNPECYYSTPACMMPSLKPEKSYTCNQNTGTYWIDMNLTKEGCSPACVINLETRTAEINWRCTGAIPPNPEVICQTNEDCACGTNIKTGECFVGNKEYVNTSKQCPDFCTGIAANFETRCENHVCRNVNTLNEIKVCTADAKICPDGSAVGRTGPNCEFAPCPNETCKNLCGDGKCDEIVCTAIGCPCSETAESCPQDCK